MEIPKQPRLMPGRGKKEKERKRKTKKTVSSSRSFNKYCVFIS